MKFLLAFIFLFSQTTFGQTVGRNIEFNSVSGADYYTNFVINESAKKNAANTVVSNATVARGTTNKIDNVASFTVDASAQNGYVEFTLGTVYDPATSGNCEFKGVFKGDGSLYRAQIVDGSGNLLNQTTVLTNETTWRPFSVTYPCAASGSRKVRITQTESGTAPAFSVGKLYYGQITNLQAGVPPNTFTAQVLQAGGIVTQSRPSLLSGSCIVTDTSLYTCPVVSGLFTVYPYCDVTPYAASSADATAYLVDVSTTQIQVRTYKGGSKDIAEFFLKCRKRGADEVQPAITADQWDFDWTTCPSISGSWVTNTTYTCKYMRKGGDAYFDIAIATSGAPTATNLLLTLPVTIGSSKFSSTTEQNFGASVTLIDSGTSYGGSVRWSSGSIVSISSHSTAGTYETIPQVSDTVPFTFGAGDSIHLRFSVPVLGWTENQNAPLLVGSVTSNSSSALRIESAIVAPTSGVSCTVSAPSSSWISTTTPNAAGDCTLTLSGFSATPICQITSGMVSGGLTTIMSSVRITSLTSTSLRFLHSYADDSAGTISGIVNASSESVYITCIGVR